MIARRSVWADAEVVELAAQFVPAADEVGRLQRGKEPDCVLFQQMAEHGHYSGRTQPSSTRQGIYAVAPSGAFLASLNHRDPRRVAAMLQRALERWAEMPADERLGNAAPAGDVVRWEDAYPQDGLVLEVLCRDLPRTPAGSDRAAGDGDRDGEGEGEGEGDRGGRRSRGRDRDWRRHAWNRDWAWFTAAEARALVPPSSLPDEVHEVPAALVERLARCHLVDAVRGQVPAFAKDSVREAWLCARVVAADEHRLEIAFDGLTRTDTRGRWPVRGFDDGTEPDEQSRGFDARLLGRAVWDRDAERFASFELLALGQRWGGTQFNGRGDDLAAAPMGVLLRAAADGPRVAPALIWGYGWRLPRSATSR